MENQEKKKTGFFQALLNKIRPQKKEKDEKPQAETKKRGGSGGTF